MLFRLSIKRLNKRWSFTDETLYRLFFPLDKPSHYFSWTLFRYFNKIKDSLIAKENILKSSKWYFSFLKRNIWLWNKTQPTSNHKSDKCLRLLVSDDEANKFYEDVEIIKDDNKINETSLNFWNKA